VLDNFQLCRDICNLRDNIMGVGIIENANLLAMYARDETPIPDEQKFKALFLQTEIIASMTESNADFFGQPKLFSLYFDYFDMYFFPMSRYIVDYGRKATLAVMIKAPYYHEELVSEITEFLIQNLNKDRNSHFAES